MNKTYIFIIISVIGVIALIADFIMKGLKEPINIKYLRTGSLAAILVGLLGWGITAALEQGEKKTNDEVVPT